MGRESVRLVDLVNPHPDAKVPKLVDYDSTSTDSEEKSVSDKATEGATKKRIHKMYSRAHKKKVAYYARHHGIRKAARYYGVQHRNVQRWVKEQVNEIAKPTSTKCLNKKGQGRKISYPRELEEKLLAWILEKRDEQFVAVSTQLIRLKALSLIKDTNPDFKASEGWLRKFMWRNNLVLRARTHISQCLPKDLEEKIRLFREEVKKIQENSDYPLQYICNMDETPVFLDMVPNKVIDSKGKKSIRVHSTNSGKKFELLLRCVARLQARCCHHSSYSKEKQKEHSKR